MSTPEILKDASTRMEQAATKVGEDFGSIRTGRANPQILNKVQVEYYGTSTPLQQLASFSVPEPRILVVSPYDKSAVSDVEKAIRESELGLNPSSDGNIIRCVFPELTQERRQDFIKLAREYAEAGRVAVRNVRRQAREAIGKMKDDGDIGEDDAEREQKKLDDLTAKHVATIDENLAAKEKDLSEV